MGLRPELLRAETRLVLMCPPDSEGSAKGVAVGSVRRSSLLLRAVECVSTASANAPAVVVETYGLARRTASHWQSSTKCLLLKVASVPCAAGAVVLTTAITIINENESCEPRGSARSKRQGDL